MASRFRIAIGVWLICCLPMLMGQQAESPATSGAEDLPVVHASSEFVLVDALVENPKTGNLIVGLEPGDFELTENGVPQAITYLSRDRLPLSIVFLFDLTETVEPVLQKLAQGASLILDHLKPEDEVSVMVFSSHTQLLQGFTTRRISTEAAIDQAAHMKTAEGTFIDEDVYESVDQALQATAPQGRRVLVWLTDGTANYENSITRETIGKEAPARLHSKQEATGRLLHSGVVVAALIERSELTDSLVAVAQRNPALVPGGARVGDIAHYAQLTGGPVRESTTKGALTQLAQLLDDLRGRYTLGYKPQTSAPEGTFCKLHVSLTPQAYEKHPEWKKSDIAVRSETGYYR